eukprot:11626599-Prorocentrum_lima.AAC.1
MVTLLRKRRSSPKASAARDRGIRRRAIFELRASLETPLSFSPMSGGRRHVDQAKSSAPEPPTW